MKKTFCEYAVYLLIFVGIATWVIPTDMNGAYAISTESCTASTDVVQVNKTDASENITVTFNDGTEATLHVTYAKYMGLAVPKGRLYAIDDYGDYPFLLGFKPSESGLLVRLQLQNNTRVYSIDVNCVDDRVVLVIDSKPVLFALNAYA